MLRGLRLISEASVRRYQTLKSAGPINHFVAVDGRDPDRGTAALNGGSACGYQAFSTVT